MSGEREAVLPFISRRHARPELDEVLAARAFPVPTPQVVRSARPVPIPVGWPVGAPPPPIRVQQLWGLDGTSGERTMEEMRDWVRRGSAALREVADGSHTAEKVEGQVWLRDLMPDWAVRIGGATDLADQGASPLLLQAKGRWASDIGRI